MILLAPCNALGISEITLLNTQQTAQKALIDTEQRHQSSSSLRISLWIARPHLKTAWFHHAVTQDVLAVLPDKPQR